MNIYFIYTYYVSWRY